MYRIPSELDLSPVVGEFTTQVRVGQFDLQFTLGDVSFMIASPVSLLREGKIIGRWEEGRWPDPGFFEIMNVKVNRCEIPSDRRIVIEFENGIAMHLEDNSDRYETMHIRFEKTRALWII